MAGQDEIIAVARLLVCGFAFSDKGRDVLLIRKKRPAWQSGFLNGVGGHIRQDEGSQLAIVREFMEETGIATSPDQWTMFARAFVAHQAVVYFFQTHIPGDLAERAAAARLSRAADEDETLECVRVAEVSTRSAIGNLRWLLPLALDPCVGQVIDFSETSLRYRTQATAPYVLLHQVEAAHG